MAKIPIDKVREFQGVFLDRMRASHKEDVLDVLEAGGMDEGVEKIIKEVASSVARHYIVKE